MAIYLVEARRTYEWGGYYEADSREEAERRGKVDMHFEPDCIVDEQVISKVIVDESVVQ